MKSTSNDALPPVSQEKKPAHGPHRKRRRSLVLCFDGTGNKFSGTPADSNILKIYSLLQHENVDQYSYYQPGIGTYVQHRSLRRASGYYTRFRSWWTKNKDMMVGTSFAEHVVAGYTFIMKYYKQDDDIYIFGFSRGAYTARFLAEMLDYVGLLQAGNEEMVRFAWKTFSNWQTRRVGDGHTREKNETTYEFMKKFRETFSRPIKPIRFLGLFDTVNSVPFFEVAWMQRTKYPYTARTSAKVIRHAVSIDERRSKFRQDLIADKSGVHAKQNHFREWAHDLREARERRGTEHMPNGQQATTPEEKERPKRPEPTQRMSSSHRFRPTMRHGHRTNKDLEFEGDDDQQRIDEENSSDEEANDDTQDIEEVWFSGGHGDIGGGWQIEPGESPNPASHITLLWMIREGLRAGVPFDVEKLRASNFFPHESSSKQYKNPPSSTTGNTSTGQPAKPGDDDLRDTFFESLHAAEASRVHDTLKFGDGLPRGGVAAWVFLEWLPFRRMDLQPDGSWRPIRWPLPRGETRDMPKHAVIHGSVIRRMAAAEKYRPGNLIVGGGGRVARVAPKHMGTGKWKILKEEGDMLGEVWVRDDDDGNEVEAQKKDA